MSHCNIDCAYIDCAYIVRSFVYVRTKYKKKYGFIYNLLTHEMLLSIICANTCFLSLTLRPLMALTILLTVRDS